MWAQLGTTHKHAQPWSVLLGPYIHSAPVRPGMWFIPVKRRRVGGESAVGKAGGEAGAR